MKYLVMRTHKALIGGKRVFVKKGQVITPDEKNVHLKPLDGGEEKSLDFLTASEDELKESKWKFDDAAAAIKAEFNVDLTKEEGTLKSDVVAQILDARYRQV